MIKKLLLCSLALFLTLFTNAQNVPSYVPTNGLVGWWPFNGNANDESGNGNNGTVYGAISAIDRNGIQNRSYFFNGSGNYINIPFSSSIGIQQNFSSSVWINMQGGGCNPRVYELHEVLNCGGYTLGFNGSGTGSRTFHTAGFGSCYSGGVYLTGGNNPVTTNIWHHIAITINGSTGTGKLYVDGILVYQSSGSQIPAINYYGAALCIGNIDASRCDWWGGYIDDLALYNRALTSAEVNQLFTSQNSNSGTSTIATSANFPSGIAYQAVARDSTGQPIGNAAISVRFTLRDSSLNGTVVYAETHNLTTNALGLFTATIGSGTAQTGTYAGINWMGPVKFLQVEVNTGSGYQLIGGQQLLSVPYANAADNATKALKIKNASLPVYSDNNSALSGGLQPGDMYRTPTGDLKIVY